MKKQLSLFCSILLVSMASAQTTWNTTLNSGTSAPKFGLSTDNTLGFYTNNIQRLTLTGAGRFGIGTVTPVAELHVVGKGLFSGGVNSNGPITFSDQFFLRYIKGSGADPNIYYTGPLGGTVTFKAPCNVFYKDLIQYDPNGTPSSVPFSPPVANLFNDIIQLKLSTGTPASVLNMGVLSNGDGVIAVEPIAYNGTTTNMLKLNPGCSSDVYVCEGGGATKIFGRGYVVGDFEANSNVRIGAPPFAANARFELKAIGAIGNVVNIWNPSSVATDKSLFRLSNTGKTLIGTNLSSTAAMLTVGQSVKADKALVLTDNTSTTNKDFFTVQGNGYTEIKVYAPSAMPNNRVLTVYDNANARDLFVVKSDGKVYAREVEISLATTFPDYVFDTNYRLRTIPETERFIRDHRHLPNFEPASSYETKGIAVSDLLLKQQQQLEEQMLYIIQLEKRLKALEETK